MVSILGYIVPLKQIEYGVYKNHIITYPKPYSIYLKGDYKVTWVVQDFPSTVVSMLGLPKPGWGSLLDVPILRPFTGFESTYGAPTTYANLHVDSVIYSYTKTPSEKTFGF